MAYPPVIPPATRSNATLELDAHPTDHNQLATALGAVAWGAAVRPVVVNTDQAGIGATAVDLTGFTLTLQVVAGRWYRVSWLLCAQVSTQTTAFFNVLLDGANVSVGSWTPATSWYTTVSGSFMFSGGAAVGGNPAVGAGARIIKMTGRTTAGTMSILNGTAVNGRLAVDDVGATANTP